MGVFRAPEMENASHFLLTFSLQDTIVRVARPHTRRALLDSIIIIVTNRHVRYALVDITVLLLARHTGTGILVPLAPTALPAPQHILPASRVNIRAITLRVVRAVLLVNTRDWTHNLAAPHARV